MPGRKLRDRGPAWWQVGSVATVLLAIAYANGLDGAFVFDDEPAIVKNESIRSLWPLTAVLWTTGDTGRTQDSRPLFNLSLALNYAAHGLWRPGFRIGNLVIHLLNVCLVFEIVRRLADLSDGTPRGQDASARHRWLAATASVIWALHPLHTHVVTYVTQRAESLGATFILGAFLLAVVAVSRADRRAALAAGIVAACGAGAKETTISILPLVAAFDWAWRDRLPAGGERSAAAGTRSILYGGLALNPVILIWLHLLMGGRGHSAGYGSVPPHHSLLTQAEAVWMYVAKTIWPATLVLDHGDGVRERLLDVWPWVVLSVALLATTAIGFVRRPKVWFWAVAALLLLAPSSSLIPVATQTVAEHRMYLASSAVVAAAVFGLATATGHPLAGTARLRAAWPVGAAVVVVVAAIARITLRNRDFADAPTLWTQNVRDCPRNVRGLTNLAGLFIVDQRYDRAAEIYADAARIPVLRVAAASGLGDVRRRQGRWIEAASAYRSALGGDDAPSAARLAATVGLAACALHERDPRAALAWAEGAEDPGWDAVRMPAGDRWNLLGRAAAYRAAAMRQVRPGDADAAVGTCLAFVARHPSAAEAIARACGEVGEFAAAALLWEPLAARDPSLLANLAVSRIEAGQIDGAIEAFERAVAAYPDDPRMRANLDRARTIARRAAAEATGTDQP